MRKPSLSGTDDAVSHQNEHGKRSLGNTSATEKPKRLKTKSLYRQPTVNELNRLQETESLFNSNLFRLQVEEILEEVKIKEKTEKKLQQWFIDLKKFLLLIPEDDKEYDLSEDTLVKKLKVKIPLSEKLKKNKCIFKFHKFEYMEIVGSHALNCSLNSKLHIDVQITVPTNTFTKNDSVNYRYHRKRAAYLACIASYLKKYESIEELTYTHLNYCQTKPVLDIKPTGKLSKHFIIRINLVCDPEAYKLHRFSPNRNNLREYWLLSEDKSESNDVGPATPFYNHSILADLTSFVNHGFLKETLANSENLKQAIILLKIWLRQRKLQVSGHIISLFVVYLHQIKRINNIMSSYQIVRNVWIALKTSEWDTKGISLNQQENMDEFLQHYPVVFLDKSGCYNLCWNMFKGTYNALRRESALAVEMLDNGKINSFTPLFMIPVQPLIQFDHMLSFRSIENVVEAIVGKETKESRINYGLEELTLVINSILELLYKGLGNRVTLILQIVDDEFSWSIKESLKKAQGRHELELSFGIILNADNASNVVEKGPPANLPEAEQFRSFWGSKSELRRFQDGSITEACVWEGDTLCEKRTITKQIIDYLMILKFDICPSQLLHICDQLDSLISRKKFSTQCEESSVEVLRAFDELRRDIRGLTQLPLDVNAVYGVSPVFSYCEPLPAVPHGAIRKPWQRGNACLVKDIARPEGIVVPEYTPVCKAIIELGHSGKWPGDLNAFRCLKAAFHLQIAERLNKQHSLPTQAYPTHIDVLKNGLVFRLEIAHPKEITLLRRDIVNGVVKFKESEESVNLQRDTVLLPRLRGALHGLHQKYPAFGPTVCILKRFLSAHLLSPPHFPSEVAELLVASVFANPEPLAAPTHPLPAFMRVLTLLADTDWSTEMIVLDFNEDMKREEIVEIEQKFNSRDRSQPPYIYIVTAYDGELPSAWSARAPDAAGLARARALSRSAIRYLSQPALEQNALRAFVPSLEGYDIIIELHEHLVPYSSERLGSLAELRQLPTTLVDNVIPVVEFDPVRKYLDELRSAYNDFALFFHDSYGGTVIAVLWKPDIAEFRDFQIVNINAVKRIEVNGVHRYKVNLAALIEDFILLGAGLVKDVTMKTIGTEEHIL